jgi:outer membrane lipoprotein SlyB
MRAVRLQSGAAASIGWTLDMASRWPRGRATQATLRCSAQVGGPTIARAGPETFRAGAVASKKVTVTLDNGQTVAIIQPGDIRDFRQGDRVRVVGTADNARVTR